MKTFNTLAAIVFAIFTALCAWAGFHNPVHFLLAAGGAVLTLIALVDDSDGESIIDRLKKR